MKGLSRKSERWIRIDARDGGGPSHLDRREQDAPTKAARFPRDVHSEAPGEAEFESGEVRRRRREGSRRHSPAGRSGAIGFGWPSRRPHPRWPPPGRRAAPGGCGERRRNASPRKGAGLKEEGAVLWEGRALAPQGHRKSRESTGPNEIDRTGASPEPQKESLHDLSPMPAGRYAPQRRTVAFWSEGTRVAGDLYLPKGRKPEDKLPTILLCHGWGGVKADLVRQAVRFSQDGFIALAFDCRGWGESDSKLVMVEKMPKPDEKGEVTVRVKALREVVDPSDEAFDIRHALDWLVGEPGVDTSRIGLRGTS